MGKEEEKKETKKTSPLSEVKPKEIPTRRLTFELKGKKKDEKDNQ